MPLTNHELRQYGSGKGEAATRRFASRDTCVVAESGVPPHILSKDRPSRRRNTAFTLIELLVVIAIILLLIGLAVPAVNSIKEQAKRKHTRALVATVATTFETYYSEYDRWPGQAVSGVFSFSDPMSGRQWTNSSQVSWVMGNLLPTAQKNYKQQAYWVDDRLVTDAFGDVIHITITNDRVYVTSVNL